MITTPALADTHKRIATIDTARAATEDRIASVGEHDPDQGICMCRACCPMVTVSFRGAVFGACARVSEV